MEKRNDFRFSFLTWNLYLGAELTSLLSIRQEQIPKMVTKVFRQFLATNFPVRVKVLANEIARKKPDFIGLQEAVRWQLVIPNFRIVTYDYVQWLQFELKKRGLDYEVAAQNKNLSVELPDNCGNLIQVLDRDVILIRKARGLKIAERMEANFKNNLNVQIAGHRVEVIRGWSSIDVESNGKMFRMINTHLDTVTDIQVEQGKEILEGPADTMLPLIITGDLNSNAEGNGITYRNFISAGFHDVWREVGKGHRFTCCQDPDLLNAVSGLDSRIDFILFKNGWRPIQSNVVGEKQHDRTAKGLWPSDHAGVSGRLIL
ncbi:endonuclease/exonuclease/phosphatase family protein [Heyndrickxia sp. NPDC080065]|uniref:endonuclease/exonuclease/phosphatase family protein n=1 Tax=Heyndrickxia sp. NPDC080065 TaxID=3390568 RepID=UPI003D00866A